MLKWSITGGLAAFAAFCVFGFLASGELSGNQELAWRSGYAIAGISALAAIGFTWWKSRSRRGDDAGRPR